VSSLPLVTPPARSSGGLPTVGRPGDSTTPGPRRSA
jgi:hypothetical protein